jgi:uncharacterized protein (TIGR03435 family)
MSAVPFLAGWALRSAMLILSGALLLWALRVKDASIRLAAWITMLCGSLAVPILTATLPEAPLAAIRVAKPAIPERRSGALWSMDRAALAFVGADSRMAPGNSAERTAISKLYSWPRLAFTIYVTLAAVLLLRLFAGLVLSGRLRRRCRPAGRTTHGIEILESDDVSGPLTLGIAHTAIILPCDWRDWDGVKLDAVLAHERSHILRRDPAVQLLSAIHRALAWHNPLSWFLHRRIVRTAEEVSDDAAVAAVRNRASYAEMLLEFMERGLRAPKWQGVAMARYGKPEERIHRILDGTAASQGITRRSMAAVLALGSPLVFMASAAHLERASSKVSPQISLQISEIAASTRETAVAAAPVPEKLAESVPERVLEKPIAPRSHVRETRLAFQSASIKRAAPDSRPGAVRALPGGEQYTAGDTSVKLLISLMYKVPTRQITEGPAWLDTDGYDIEANAGGPHSIEDLHVMFQNLLADGFKLKFHREIKEGPVYALTVGTAGQRMTLNEGPNQFDFPITRDKDGVVIGTRVPMEYFCWWLSQVLTRDGRPVIDRTGLSKNYDFTLSFAPQLPPDFPREKVPAAILARPSIFDALREQLGLQLEAQTGPVEYFVIDHIEKPAGNAEYQ